MLNVGNNEAAVLNILNEIRWQNFPPKWIDQPHFTIWQAIGYILNSAESANEILDAYVRAINDAEMELFDELCAEDTYKQLIDTNQLDESDPKVKYAKRTITGQVLQDWLPLLNQNRIVTTESFPIPALLYQVLQEEINKRLYGKGATLKIIEKDIKGFTEKQILFGKKSLDKSSTSSRHRERPRLDKFGQKVSHARFAQKHSKATKKSSRCSCTCSPNSFRMISPLAGSRNPS